MVNGVLNVIISFNQTQWVTKSTCEKGNILDLVLSQGLDGSQKFPTCASLTIFLWCSLQHCVTLWIKMSTRCFNSAGELRGDGTRLSLQILMDRLSVYQEDVKTAKTQFVSDLVSTNSHKSQVLLNVFNNITNSHDNVRALRSLSICIYLLAFFADKVSAIRSYVWMSTVSDPSVPTMCSAILEQFVSISLNELSVVVHHLRSLDHPSDSLPPSLLKNTVILLGLLSRV